MLGGVVGLPFGVGAHLAQSDDTLRPSCSAIRSLRSCSAKVSATAMYSAWYTESSCSRGSEDHALPDDA